jgi:RNA polymerase sigma-70 factor, ECF subfamily
MPVTRVPEVEGTELDVEAVYRLYGRTLVGWVANLGGPSADVEDLVQEVLMVVQEQLPRFEGRSLVSTWLYRITANVLSNRRRKGRHTEGSRLELQSVPDEGVAADEVLGAADRRRKVYAILDRMKERSRTVLVLFEIEERSGEEVAQLLGIRVETLWVWLHRARAEFLKHLRRLGWEEALRAEHAGGRRAP